MLVKDHNLIKEWDYEKNELENLNPNILKTGSNKRAWWICSLGHPYKKPISERCLNGEGCPYCSGQRVLRGFNDVATTCPELMPEWDNESNEKNGITPYTVSKGYSKKVSWICSLGHHFENTINHRLRGDKCPYCAGKKVLKGYNDLATTNPELVQEWDSIENEKIGLFVDNVRPGSNKGANWICSNGHKYYKKISERALYKEGCPYCAGKKVLKGYNDLATVCPDLAKEWDYDKNAKNGLYIDKVTKGSNKKAWWICKNGHSWPAIISSRSCGRGCPYCSNKIIDKEINSLEKTHSEALKEWDYDKNNAIGLYPSEMSAGSGKLAYWICSKGHKYRMSVSKKIGRNAGCPVCQNAKFIKEYNSFELIYPEVAKEWHPTKNGNLKPSEIFCNSRDKYWWKCKMGHEWEATARDRGYGHTNCPECAKRQNTSFPEQALYFYIKKLYPNAINRYKDIFDNGMEIDIFIPDFNLGFEYDGKQFHKDEKQYDREKRKYEICKKNNIKLIRIKEGKPNLELSSQADATYYLEHPKRENEVQQLFQMIIDNLDLESNSWTRKNPFKLNSDVRVDLDRDRYKIYGEYLYEIPNSFGEKHPELLKYWDYDKNKDITPYIFPEHSNDKIYWKCPDCNHKWRSTINSMSNSNGCPICGLAIRGKHYSMKVCETRSLEKLAPDELLDEFVYELNDLSPSEVSIGSSKPLYWKCHKCGYVWKASARARMNNSGCPRCSGRVPMEGVDDLGTLYPEQILDWDYNKNTSLPSEYLPGSPKKVYWKCHKCGNEWVMPIRQRSQSNSGCPKCSSQRGKSNQKKIYQYTLDGDFIKEWDSATIVEKELGFKASNIASCAREEVKTSYGYIWKYNK